VFSFYTQHIYKLYQTAVKFSARVKEVVISLLGWLLRRVVFLLGQGGRSVTKEYRLVLVPLTMPVLQL